MNENITNLLHNIDIIYKRKMNIELLIKPAVQSTEKIPQTLNDFKMFVDSEKKRIMELTQDEYTLFFVRNLTNGFIEELENYEITNDLNRLKNEYEHFIGPDGCDADSDEIKAIVKNICTVGKAYYDSLISKIPESESEPEKEEFDINEWSTEPPSPQPPPKKISLKPSAKPFQPKK